MNFKTGLIIAGLVVLPFAVGNAFAVQDYKGSTAEQYMLVADDTGIDEQDLVDDDGIFSEQGEGVSEADDDGMVEQSILIADDADTDDQGLFEDDGMASEQDEGLMESDDDGMDMGDSGDVYDDEDEDEMALDTEAETEMEVEGD